MEQVGSIPVITDKIGYPIGIKDYKQLFGKDFDLEAYKKVHFRYYVGEFETINKTNSRVDEDGNLTPLHDMSYFDRSVPTIIGQNQRKVLGRDLFERAINSVDYLRAKGIDITHEIIKGRAHRDMSVNKVHYEGVKELGDRFIDDIFREFDTPSGQNKINEKV